MKAGIKTLIKYFLKKRGKNAVFFGKNRGFKYQYSEDLNLDMMMGVHEPNTFEVFDLFVKENMIVADIGANVGYFSKFLSGKVGAGGHVFAFEPIPRTFGMLQSNIQLNGLKNITPVNAAVTDNNGTIKIYLSHTHYMASVDVNWASKEGGEIDVKGITLDSFFEEKGVYPDFIKMDIEGGGVQALKGMVNCILRKEPVLFLESHTSAEDLAIGQALSLADYDVYRVGSTVPVKSLQTDYTDEHGIYATVVGIPKSKSHLFGNWTATQFQKNRFGQR